METEKKIINITQLKKKFKKNLKKIERKKEKNGSTCHKNLSSTSEILDLLCCE